MHDDLCDGIRPFTPHSQLHARVGVEDAVGLFGARPIVADNDWYGIQRRTRNLRGAVWLKGVVDPKLVEEGFVIVTDELLEIEGARDGCVGADAEVPGEVPVVALAQDELCGDWLHAKVGSIEAVDGERHVEEGVEAVQGNDTIDRSRLQHFARAVLIVEPRKPRHPSLEVVNVLDRDGPLEIRKNLAGRGVCRVESEGTEVGECLAARPMPSLLAPCGGCEKVVHKGHRSIDLHHISDLLPHIQHFVHGLDGKLGRKGGGPKVLSNLLADANVNADIRPVFNGVCKEPGIFNRSPLTLAQACGEAPHHVDVCAWGAVRRVRGVDVGVEGARRAVLASRKRQCPR
mmetsp:Transcript_29057/g.73154  ORF Transcript_29057/g.73154 Transcript_29057/m.73154 type:complete len:345 (-) Transcript_29057:78-1112(-)